MNNPDNQETIDQNFPEIGDRVQFLQIPRQGDRIWHQGTIGSNNGKELAIDVDSIGRFFCPRRSWGEKIRFLDRPDPDFNRAYYLP